MEELTPVNTKEEVEALRLMSLAGEKRKEIGELEAQLLEKKSVLSTFIESIKEKETAIEAQETLLEDLKAQQTSLEADIVVLTETITQKEQTIKDLELSTALNQEAHNKTVASLNAEIHQIKQDFELEQDKYAKLVEEIAMLEISRQTFVDSVHKAEGELQKTLSETEKAKADLGDLKDSISVKKSSLKELENKEVATLARIAELEETEKHVTAKEAELRKSIIEEHELHIATLKADEGFAEARFYDAKEALARLNEEQEAVKALVETKREEINAIKRSALIEIGRVVEGNRLEKLPESVQDAINSITKA